MCSAARYFGVQYFGRKLNSDWWIFVYLTEFAKVLFQFSLISLKTKQKEEKIQKPNKNLSNMAAATQSTAAAPTAAASSFSSASLYVGTFLLLVE
jgi:hypothetical protein